MTRRTPAAMIVSLLIGIVLCADPACPRAAGQTPVQLAPREGKAACSYPNVARLAGNRLLCVYSTWEDAARRRVVIEGITSDDHGKTWGAPVTLIDASPDLSYDPNIVVIGDSAVVCSTTVPETHSRFVSTSRILAARSDDGGRTWSHVAQIPIDHRYVAGKVHAGLVLDDGTAMFGIAWDKGLETKERVGGDRDQVCVISLIESKDRGLTWTQGVDLSIDLKKTVADSIEGIDEPAIVRCPDGSIYMLCRTGFDKLFDLRSRDGGRTWSAPKPSPLTCHNAPASLCEIKGARPGIMAVWTNSPQNRWPLAAAASFDNGATWTKPRVLAEHPGVQSSYSSCVQAADGTLVVVWLQDHIDRQSTVDIARFGLDWLVAGE